MTADDDLRRALPGQVAVLVRVIDGTEGQAPAGWTLAAIAEPAALAVRSEDIACTCANGDGTSPPKYHAPHCQIAIAARSEPPAEGLREAAAEMLAALASEGVMRSGPWDPRTGDAILALRTALAAEQPE